VPSGLTEKVANWITLKALGDSGAGDNARCRAGNFFILPGPPHPIAHPEASYFLGPGLPTLVVDSPAVPIITAIGSGYGNDLTPREPWPIPYGMGEFAPVGAAALVDDGRVAALFNAILRDRYFDRADLANDEVMLLIARWLIDWSDPGGRRLLYFCTEPELGTYHIPGAIVTKWFDVLKDYRFEVENQVGGEITPELLQNFDILQLAELMRSLSPDEIQAVVNFVKAGGGLIIMCQADYAGYGRPRYPNEVLEALNCPIRFQDDELYDDNSWVVDGPWYPQVYLLDPREVNSKFDVWFPAYDFTTSMPTRSMTIEDARVLFSLTITNMGTRDSSYGIEVWETTTPENLGWEIEVKPTEAEVASGENIEIAIFVTVPDIEAGRKRMDLSVRVTDSTQTFLTKSGTFAILGEDGRTPSTEAKFEVGQKVSHVSWGEGTVDDVGYAGGGVWAYLIETTDGKLVLAAEGDLGTGAAGIPIWIIAAAIVVIVVVVAAAYFVLIKKR